MDSVDVRRSRRLALVLRHRPSSIGLVLDEHGWTDVAPLLVALQRDRIRARQGHTVAVDLALSPVSPPDLLFHGTARRSVASIILTGLDPRGRHHVHLSGDAETARQVGARRGKHAVLRIDAAAMAAAGHTFWRTDNGVWLVETVPPRFIATT